MYIFIAGWIFLLGVMVGRGTSPVEFDTLKFQKRLETIAREFGKKKEPQKKIDLKFYEVLDHPVPEEGPVPKKNSMEIIPKKEPAAATDVIPEKKSRKKTTIKKQENISSPDSEIKKPLPVNNPEPVPVISKSADLQKTKAQVPVMRPDISKGAYTIQVSAHSAFKDAVTQMALLEEKGFSTYRVKGEKDGVTWYRVRTGSFASYDEAKAFQEKLDKAQIKSMIIKEGK